MKNALALIFLIISFIVTLLLWGFVAGVPGVPNPAAG